LGSMLQSKLNSRFAAGKESIQKSFFK